MRKNIFGARGLIKLLAVLGLVVFLFLGYVGFTLATNYNNLGNLVRVITLIKTHYLHTVDTDSMVEGAVKGLVESLDDPYSTYLEPQTFKQLTEQIHGSFGGLGILVGIEDEYLKVVRPYEGTPAERAGILEGDIITHIDNKDVKGVGLDTAISLMRGPVGTKVKLTIQRDHVPQPLEFTLVREEIRLPTVEGKVLPENKDIGYILLAQFTENTPVELSETLDKLKKQKIKGLILDLRNNPGGELQAAVRVADQFIAEGPIVHIDYKTGRDQTFKADKLSLNLPLVVLQNEHTASAAEILAGAIKDHGVGKLVGTTTFGKGVVQTLFPLDNGAGLKLTTARYLTPNRYDINKRGIQPDVKVQMPENAASDVQLEKAVEIIEKQIAG